MSFYPDVPVASSLRRGTTRKRGYRACHGGDGALSQTGTGFTNSMYRAPLHIYEEDAHARANRSERMALPEPRGSTAATRTCRRERTIVILSDTRLALCSSSMQFSFLAVDLSFAVPTTVTLVRVSGVENSHPRSCTLYLDLRRSNEPGFFPGSARVPMFLAETATGARKEPWFVRRCSPYE
jgi:hypothetical protein